jgi:hypothetical protein
MVLADSRKASPTPRYSGYCYVHIVYVYGTITLYRLFFQTVLLSFMQQYRSPTTPTMPKHYWFGLFPFRSPLLRESLLFSLPPLT